MRRLTPGAALFTDLTVPDLHASKIDATDREIDRLVYELYELTDEEIAIVEAGTA